MEILLIVHIHWASDARDQRSHAGLHSFKANQQCGIHMYTAFFHYIVIVFVRNYHNMVNTYCIHMYTTLLVTWETVKPCMRSRMLCMRCSVYVYLLNVILCSKFEQYRTDLHIQECLLGPPDCGTCRNCLLSKLMAPPLTGYLSWGWCNFAVFTGSRWGFIRSSGLTDRLGEDPVMFKMGILMLTSLMSTKSDDVGTSLSEIWGTARTWSSGTSILVITNLASLDIEFTFRTGLFPFRLLRDLLPCSQGYIFSSNDRHFDIISQHKKLYFYCSCIM